MAARHWMNRTAGSLLLLAAIVGVLGVLFGNAYVSHGDEHAEEASAGQVDEHAEEGEQSEEGEHAEEEDEHAAAADEGGSKTVKIVGSIAISTAGVALVPLGLFLLRRRRREEENVLQAGESPRPAGVPPEPAGHTDYEWWLRPALALLSVGAAVIHFVVIPGHWDEYWGQVLFFVVAAVAQLLWAVWIIVAPSRLIYLAGAAGNAAIVVMWIVTRTAGVPAGPGAGEAEAVEFADTLATVFEVILVVGALLLARAPSRRVPQVARSALTPTLLLACVVAALTAASLLSLVEL
jgi:MYXO-CTERM domain-containing protein